jgi:hypothetical protein
MPNPAPRPDSHTSDLAASWQAGRDAAARIAASKATLTDDQRFHFNAICTAEMPANHKAVMQQIASRARGGNRAYASLAKIAWYAGMTKRAVQLAIHGDPRSKNPARRAGLAAVDAQGNPTPAALLELTQRENSPGQFRTRKYTIRWDRLHRRGPAPGESKRPNRVRIDAPTTSA